jgi:Na+-driven multidrug efflux pump
VAAQSVLRNLGMYSYMIPFGISTSLNYHVGKSIGNGRLEVAQTMITLSQVISGVVGISQALMFYCNRDWIVSRYSENEEVEAVLVNTWTLFCAVVLFESL